MGADRRIDASGNGQRHPDVLIARRCQRHHDDELIAATAGDHVHVASCLSQDDAGELLQEPVALRVPERVVEALQVVDVDHEHREVLGIAARLGDLLA